MIASGGYRGDGRTRNSHRHMSDVIIFWNDPPAPEDLFPTGYKNTLGHYHAGCCPNCRCSASPLVFIEDLKFPVRVYTNGKIVSMDRTSFLKLYNGKIAELKAEKRPKEQAKITQIKKSPEELAKEKKAKEEERFLNEQRAKVNRLVSEINFYLKQIKIIEESLRNQTDRKIIKAETDKINKYSRIIEKYKQELEKIRDSIVISNGSFVGDSLVRDLNIIEFFIELARELKESIENINNNIPETKVKNLPKSIDKISAKGRNDFDIEFNEDENDKTGFYYHVNKHIQQFQNLFTTDKEKELYQKLRKNKIETDEDYKKLYLTKEEYKILGKVYDKEGQNLVKKEVNKKAGILGYKDRDDNIVRYDKNKNLYVIGDFLTGNIVTFYKPDKGLKYFKGQREKKQTK